MPFIVPFIPLIAAVAGPLLAKAIGGSGGSSSSSSGASGGAAAPAATPATATPTKLFTNPSDISNAVNQYKTDTAAKWNQIAANMGAGNTGQFSNLSDAINNQAEGMAGALGGLTTASGYGDTPSNLTAIMQGVEPGISAKYPLY